MRHASVCHQSKAIRLVINHVMEATVHNVLPQGCLACSTTVVQAHTQIIVTHLNELCD